MWITSTPLKLYEEDEFRISDVPVTADLIQLQTLSGGLRRQNSGFWMTWDLIFLQSSAPHPPAVLEASPPQWWLIWNVCQKQTKPGSGPDWPAEFPGCSWCPPRTRGRWPARGCCILSRRPVGWGPSDPPWPSAGTAWWSEPSAPLTLPEPAWRTRDQSQTWVHILTLDWALLNTWTGFSR